MKQAYLEPKNWSAKKRVVYQKIVAIVKEYQEQGYKMTLRQLYYQLVSRDVIPNQASEYAKLSTLLTEARAKELLDKHFMFGGSHNWFSTCPTCETVKKLRRLGKHDRDKKHHK